MQNHGPFLHSTTNRRYWWSASQQRYVFDDGTPVPVPAGSASAVHSTGNATGSVSVGSGLSRGAAASPSSLTPRYVRPPDPQTTVIYAPQSGAGSSQQAEVLLTPIDWRRWKPGQPFGEGDTIHIHKGEGEPPVKMGQLLGSGSFATVLAVQVQNSSGLCALKIYKSRPSLALVTFRQKFENEIHNMRRVSNRHIARFYGAYICERKTQPPEFGILMQPVADGGTLEFVISTYRESPMNFTKQHRDHLATAFGCLSSALEFVHRHMIRHKDVKSDNILMHKGKVMLTDFGSSWAGVGDLSLVTNTDHPQGYTPRYAAPEVMKKEQRSTKSDVFSLGGVFYEILSAIQPDMHWYKGEYCKVNTKVRGAFAQWKNAVPEAAPLIYRMLDSDPDKRPSARGLVESLPEKHFCAECWQDRRKMAPAASVSSTGKQLESAMAGMSLGSNQAKASGSGLTFASSAGARSQGASNHPTSHGSAARRGSVSTTSVSQGVARSNATYGQTYNTRRPSEDDDSDDDDDEDEEDSSDDNSGTV